MNFPDEGGITAYFGRNMSKEDLKLSNEFLASQNIDVLNTRTFKEDDGTIVLTVGSINKSSTNHEFKGTKFRVDYGEFAPYLDE